MASQEFRHEKALSKEQNRYAYLVTMIFSLVFFVLFRTVAKKKMYINTLLTYVFLTIGSIFAIIIGTVSMPSEPAVSFNIFLVLVPFWAYDMAIRSILYRVGICIVYFICVFKFKDSSVAWIDVMDALAYGTLGTIIGLVNQKLNTSAYYLRNNMKKEIDEKTASLENDC